MQDVLKMLFQHPLPYLIFASVLTLMAWAAAKISLYFLPAIFVFAYVFIAWYNSTEKGAQKIRSVRENLLENFGM